MSQFRNRLIFAARRAGLKKVETPDHPCRACGETEFYATGKSGYCVNCKSNCYRAKQTTSKAAQDRAQCPSDAQDVKVYRKDCQGCIYANESVCCGGVR